MEYADYVRQGLEGEEQLKLILCGSIQDMGSGRAGVVSVVYATKNRDLAEDTHIGGSKPGALLHGLQRAARHGFNRTPALSINRSYRGRFSVEA